jgi:hypothetical protein
MRDNLTLSRAIAMVGGLRNDARPSEIRIFRQKPGEGIQEVFKVDLSAIRKNRRPDFKLQPFDMIDVPDASPFSWQTVLPMLLGNLQRLMVVPAL